MQRAPQGVSFSAASLRAVLTAHAPVQATGLVVSLSGGADSANLLAAAASLQGSFRGLSVRAVHVDHGLQAAAAAFREACASLCKSCGVPLTVLPLVLQVPQGASIEAAARDARYAALAAELKPGECLLTAHHSEDQAQTLLLQALRGAGLKGLSAMPLCRALGQGWHLRPVLEIPQDRLLGPGAHLSGACAPDPMNEDERFDRSYLRRQVWPLIEARWPGAGATLARVARHAGEAQALLDATAAADVGRLRDGEALSVPGLRALVPQARINALRFWLSEGGVDAPSAARLSEALRQMLDAQIDRLPAVAWGSYVLRRYRQRIFLTSAHPPQLQGRHLWSTESVVPLDLGPNLGELRWVAQAGGLDSARLPPTLMVRRRVGGETLKPGPEARTQTLQHLCQSQGVLPWMRDAMPLVFAGDSLVAAGDLWLDARHRVAAGAAGIAIRWARAPIMV
ncbi:MAG: tRNA lysidine(34) synthetase TilS [Gammaproteobacteria bacterium]